MVVIANIVHRIFQLVMLLVLTQVILSYFMSPYVPLRKAIDRIVEPMLAPIRRILPRTGALDFSPLALIILIQILDIVIRNILLSF